jgi:hypothetical protein
MSLNFFNLCNPSNCTMALGFIQPLTEMSIRLSSWGRGEYKAQSECSAENLSTICDPNVTSHNPTGLHGLLQGQLLFDFNLLETFLYLSDI